ncbi:lysozyme-like protein [Agrocybe pediades]|nr:lysozyme-like protein [Agrocybe pediades]
MRLITSTLALFLSLSLVNAASVHDHAAVAARHNRIGLSLRETSLDIELRATSSGVKRCINRKNKNSNSSTGVSSSASSSTPAAVKPTSSKASAKPASTPKPTQKAAPPAPPQTNGLLVSSACGGSRATKQITTISGPNGNIDWLNCGFESPGGWQPPHVGVHDIITESLSTALQNPSSPFQACGKYIWLFEKYGNMHDIPPIIMASFAMQESGCNPATVGGGGEQGLMQITKEKCAGAPGGDCKDPEFNIATATKFFAQTLSNSGGNILQAVGQYNGWHIGLTKWAAFAAANSACCRCQNNGDYLMQFFNGWILNVNAYSSSLPLGKYFNLKVCG